MLDSFLFVFYCIYKGETQRDRRGGRKEKECLGLGLNLTMFLYGFTGAVTTIDCFGSSKLVLNKESNGVLGNDSFKEEQNKHEKC